MRYCTVWISTWLDILALGIRHSGTFPFWPHLPNLNWYAKYGLTVSNTQHWLQWRTTVLSATRKKTTAKERGPMEIKCYVWIGSINPVCLHLHIFLIIPSSSLITVDRFIITMIIIMICYSHSCKTWHWCPARCGTWHWCPARCGTWHWCLARCGTWHWCLARCGTWYWCPAQCGTWY